MGVKTWELCLEHEVPHHIRAWNKGTSARVSVYGKIDLQLYCGYVFMCTAAGRRKWAAAAAQTLPDLPVQPLVSKGSMDKFVQPVTVMKGEKLDRANELLVNALTANLLPSANEF